tara:strand:+ start:6376 stop:7770 length:1395 start_codon:yes stop_codon:yes gene_type:complete
MTGAGEKKVFVVGDIMLDHYIFTETNRLSPESPYPVYSELYEDIRLGGAANVANNICELVKSVTLLGSVGVDVEAKKIKKLLKKRMINHFLKELVEYKTCLKKRYFCQNFQVFRTDREEKTTPISIDFIFKKLASMIAENDIFVLSDYDKGSLDNSKQIIGELTKMGCMSIVDPKRKDFDFYKGAFLITPNEQEFEAASGNFSNISQLKSNAKKLMYEHQIKNVLVTRGSKGMVLINEKKELIEFKADSKDVFDVTGAGDTVVAIIASMLAKGYDLERAVECANRGAGMVVGKIGTSTIDSRDILPESCNKVCSVNDFSDVYKVLKNKKLKIVMTNGCFDILHSGHIKCLEEASKLGQRLVVLLNSDSSVRRNKGKDRPINKFSDRLKVIQALSFVDFILPLEDETPQKIYKKFTPDILVKGGDYTIDEVIGGKEVISKGGNVRIIKLLEGVSTTELIKKIKDN